VEVRGIEPLSEKHVPQRLRTYPLVNNDKCHSKRQPTFIIATPLYDHEQVAFCVKETEHTTPVIKTRSF